MTAPQTSGLPHIVVQPVESVQDAWKLYRGRSERPLRGYDRRSTRPIWILGSRNTTRRGHIRDAGAFGETPMQTFLDATPIAKEKMIAA
jgi:hypothetical protein